MTGRVGTLAALAIMTNENAHGVKTSLTTSLTQERYRNTQGATQQVKQAADLEVAHEFTHPIFMAAS